MQGGLPHKGEPVTGRSVFSPYFLHSSPFNPKGDNLAYLTCKEKTLMKHGSIQPTF